MRERKREGGKVGGREIERNRKGERCNIRVNIKRRETIVGPTWNAVVDLGNSEKSGASIRAYVCVRQRERERESHRAAV